MKQVYVDPNKEPEEVQKADYNISRSDEALKKTFAGEKKKIAEMQGSEKIEYIIMYYKWYILGAIAIVAFIIYMIHHALTYTRASLFIDILNSSEANLDREAEITEYIGMEKHDVARMEHSVDTEADVSMGAYYKQIDLYTIADEIDVVFADEVGAAYVAGLGTTYPLENVFTDELYTLWSDKLVNFDVYDTQTEDTYYNLPVAVDISGTRVHEYFGLEEETRYILVTDLSGHEEYLQKFFQMLYDIETGVYTY